MSRWSPEVAPLGTLGRVEGEPDGFWLYLWSAEDTRFRRLEVRSDRVLASEGGPDVNLPLRSIRRVEVVEEEQGQQLFAVRTDGGREWLGAWEHPADGPAARNATSRQVRWVAAAITARAHAARGEPEPEQDARGWKASPAAPPPERIGLPRHPSTGPVLWLYAALAVAAVAIGRVVPLTPEQVIEGMLFAAAGLSLSAWIRVRPIQVDRIGVTVRLRRVPWSEIRDLRVERGDRGLRVVLERTDGGLVGLDAKGSPRRVLDELNLRRPRPSTDASAVPHELRDVVEARRAAPGRSATHDQE